MTRAWWRRARGLLRELPPTAGRRVLLHGDFNPGNVLAGRTGTWVAIDPKPMIGDPAYDLWPLLE
jgi:streptomycin 6-kinase